MVGITERGDAALDLSWKPWVESGKPAILITKDPTKLSKHILKDMNVIVHCTITALPKYIEPKVKNIYDAVYGFADLCHTLGQNRIVLRVDPIFVEHSKKQLDFITRMINTKMVQRLRISFFDAYPHVVERFNKAGINLKQQTFHAPLEERLKIVEEIKSIFPDVEICGEPDLPCTGCISKKDLQIFGIESKNLELSNQRITCKCLSQKIELLNNKKQCKHKCLYCYWKG